jgi:hypothetical protein
VAIRQGPIRDDCDDVYTIFTRPLESEEALRIPFPHELGAVVKMNHPIPKKNRLTPKLKPSLTSTRWITSLTNGTLSVIFRLRRQAQHHRTVAEWCPFETEFHHPNSIIQILLNPPSTGTRYSISYSAEQSDKSIYMYLMTVACKHSCTPRMTIVCETQEEHTR